MDNFNKTVQAKMMKGMLDLIVLQLLHGQGRHGYDIMTTIRKRFGTSYSPSIIYPLLNSLEEQGYVTSEWNLHTAKPKKTYSLTDKGERLLNCTEESLSFVCRQMNVLQGQVIRNGN